MTITAQSYDSTKPTKILIVEDDPGLQDAIHDTLLLEQIEHDLVGSAEEALERLQQQRYQLMISDVHLPGRDGNELLNDCHKLYPDLPVIMMTAYGSIDKAVNAMQLGALDYIPKPFHPSLLKEKILTYALREESEASDADPIVADPESLRLLSIAQRVAATDSTVLILGESGTGKEVMARYIHSQSSRFDQPFVAINCAAIPENMLEATLFGHEKGAFTGAHQSSPGKFELANGGTILLDEISEMDLALQAKLLRVIQEKEVERIGGKKTIPLDVRILATSNRDLKEAVHQHRFREDLFYRLNVFPIKWKPLRERRGDILPIAQYLLDKYTQRQNSGPIHFDDSARQKLFRYDWPGNVRELGNVIQRALILKSGTVITEHDLLFLEQENETVTPGVMEQTSHDESGALVSDLKNHEYQIIIDTLKSFKGSRKQTAAKLGISERTLRYKLAKMREEGIDVSEIQSA